MLIIFSSYTVKHMYWLRFTSQILPVVSRIWLGSERISGLLNKKAKKLAKEISYLYFDHA